MESGPCGLGAVCTAIDGTPAVSVVERPQTGIPAATRSGTPPLPGSQAGGTPSNLVRAKKNPRGSGGSGGEGSDGSGGRSEISATPPTILIPRSTARIDIAPPRERSIVRFAILRTSLL